jgi:hypothetical protein
MCSHYAKQQEKQEEAGYENNLIPVAWAILVMGLSLAAVIVFVCLDWAYRTYFLIRHGTETAANIKTTVWPSIQTNYN